MALYPSEFYQVFFYALPAARGLIISFTAWNLLRDPNPVGLANYREMIADPLF